MLKILHIIIGLDVGGAEIALKRLVASHEGNRNYRHKVISLTDIGAIGKQLQNLDFEVYALGMRTVFDIPRVTWKLARLIHANQPCIVQSWMYHADLIGGIVARLVGCNKVIWGVRNTDLFSNNGVSKTTGWIMKMCAVLSSYIPHTIVCVAHRAKLVHADAGYARSKLTVISNGFEADVYEPKLSIRDSIRRSINVPIDALVIGSIGRFNEYKDHRSFISAAANLASIDSRVYFLLAGRDVDSSNVNIMHWIKETDYADRFRLLGERSDVPAILAAMDIFCLHSKSEGFPNVLGEAMCAGLPSVATDVGDVAVLLGEGGLVVSPHDTEALTQSLLTMAQYSSETRTLFGKIARTRIKENYSMCAIKQDYEELYQKVMSTC